MPLYEYECDACSQRFEKIQKFSDPLVDTCPACGGPVRKLLSSPAFQFKGSGWYITDYARAGKGDDRKPVVAKDGDAAASSESSTDASSKSAESTSAAKATTTKAEAPASAAKEGM